MGMMDVAAPGPPQSLNRSLGPLGVLFLTLSVASPVSSLFATVPGMLHAAGTGAIWAMALASVICVATAYVYAELSSCWPVAGGEYVFVARTLGPMAGFVMLGVNLFNNVLFPPILGLGLAAVLGAVVPGVPQVPLALAVVVAATLVALLEIRVNAWITGVFLLIELLAVLAVVWAGIALPERGFWLFLTDPVMPGSGAALPGRGVSIGVAAAIATLALNGFGVAVYFGEEMRAAPARIGRVILWAALLTIAIEGLPIAAVLIGAPDLPALLAMDDPFGFLVSRRLGRLAGEAVALGVAVAIINAAIASILSTARFFYGTGRDRCWGAPCDALMAAIHPRFGSPWIATLATGGLGALCCLVPLPLLLVASGLGLTAIYAGIALAAIVGRVRGATAGAPFRMPWFPLAPVVTLAASLYLVVLNALDAGEGRTGLIVTAAQIALSALYYLLVVRPRGAWTVHLPVTT